MPVADNFDPNNCSKEELEAALEELDKDAGFYETQQLALKTFINSVYGATATPYFCGFNPAVAEAITLQGQDLNHFSERAVNDYFKGPFQADTELHKKLGIDTELTKKISIAGGRVTNGAPLTGPEFSYLGDNCSLVVAGDTDSVTGDSKIYVDDKEMKIEDAFNMFKSENSHFVLWGGEGQETIPVKKHTTKTYIKDQTTPENRPIKYIMRHVVTKEKWEIVTKSGKKVTMTNDHSIMVFRDNELISIKPHQVKKTDKLVTIKHS
jgi:hypothetical protein